MESTLQQVKKTIIDDVFVPHSKEPHGRDDSWWIFDFRRVLLRADVLDWVSELFWEKCGREYPFQIGGLEVTAIPLITALSIKLSDQKKPVHAFFMRKSRKREGLMRMIEGSVKEEKILLVDDTLNSGKSLIRQVEVIESLGKKVSAVFVILRFRDDSFYTYFHERGIRIYSLFDLNDFSDSLQLKNLTGRRAAAVAMPFQPVWFWKGGKPHLFQVFPKSAPVIDDTNIYFGTDEGNFWALRQSDGSVVWQYPIWCGSKKRKTFSSPVMHQQMLYFGANDGNIHALHAKTGRPLWVYREADWVEAAPCIAPTLSLLIVGTEYGLWNKQGSIIALDSSTGVKRWEMTCKHPVRSSPVYSEKHTLIIASSGSEVFGIRATTGVRVWTLIIEGCVQDSFAIDDNHGCIVFGSSDSHVYVVETNTGKLRHTIKTGEPLWSTPLIHGQYAYSASLDKNLYAINLDTGSIVWTFSTQGRIFASPLLVDTYLYIGSNDGRLYEIDSRTGKNTSFFQSVERIVNKIAYNAMTKRFFVPTFANELYCLEKTSS